MNCVISKYQKNIETNELERISIEVCEINTLNEIKDLIIENCGQNYTHAIELGEYDKKYYFSLKIIVDKDSAEE